MFKFRLLNTCTKASIIFWLVFLPEVQNYSRDVSPNLIGFRLVWTRQNWLESEETELLQRREPELDRCSGWCGRAKTGLKARNSLSLVGQPLH